MIRNSRIGLALLLALLVPAALTGAWAWLVHGGVIDDAVANERTAQTTVRATAERLLLAELQQRAARTHVKLTLDEDRRCVAPFAGVVGDPSVQTATIAEQAALARLKVGDEEGALPFFAHAHAEETLTPEACLSYAVVLQAPDPERALAVLAWAEQTYADTWCGPLPFSLLLAMHRVRAGIDVANNGTAALDAVQAIDPASAQVVLTELREIATQLHDDERTAQLLAAAHTRAQLGDRAVPDQVEPLPDATVIVPITETTAAALPAATIEIALASVVRATAAEQPEFALTMPTVRKTSWRTERLTTKASTLLSYVANSCLFLAIATLILGNLLLWRLSRRELALVRMRRDFVDVVSHELRTPLTALSLKAEMLANGDVPDARRQHYLDTLHSDVARLSDQVERILDFGRLERGAPLQRELVPTRNLVAHGLRAGLPALRLVHQNVAVEVPRTLPAVEADIGVLTRALRNLLENAAKYAPAGSTVAVRACADGNRVTVEVADTGPGVSVDERKAIFQPFVRASTATPGIQGSGLGLALVAAAAKAHGGSVDVRDRDGGGAVFTINLPAAKTPQATESAS